MIINTEEENEKALAEIDRLMDEPYLDDKMCRFYELVDSVEEFEAKHYPMDGE